MSVTDPRDIVDQQIGTHLRDAAVDPRPDDFLPPTNAGAERPLGNPHGPTVVSPEIHGQESVRTIRPGLVSSSPATQSDEETTQLADWQPQVTPPDPEGA